jgi:hypothetical protein
MAVKLEENLSSKDVISSDVMYSNLGCRYLTENIIESEVCSSKFAVHIRPEMVSLHYWLLLTFDELILNFGLRGRLIFKMRTKLF